MNFTKLLADIKIKDIIKAPPLTNDPEVLNVMRHNPPQTIGGFTKLLESAGKMLSSDKNEMADSDDDEEGTNSNQSSRGKQGKLQLKN